MRLYLKLIAMVVTAAVLQIAFAGPGEWLDETQFALRVYVSTHLGTPCNAPHLLDAAEAVRARQYARLGRVAPFPALESADELPAHTLGAEVVCDEAGLPPNVYARAG
jgi:hypothetical protein